MRKGFCLSIVVLLVFLWTPVSALPLLTIVPDQGSPGAIPGSDNVTNDLLIPIFGEGTTSRQGYYGSTVSLTESANLTFTILGFEAGYRNDFYINNTHLLFGTEDYASNRELYLWDVKGPFFFEEGVVPFSFHINDSFGVKNSDNPDELNGESKINFFVSFLGGDGTATTGNSLIVFLDDGGAGPDDNHDDFAVRIDVAPVPEPSTLVLMGLGLVGLAGLGRKTLKKRSVVNGR